MARPIPESAYYAGQGRIAIGDRDPTTGGYTNLVYPGNCTAVSIAMAADKYSHNESMTGQRAVDLTFAKTITTTFKITCESIDVRLLQLGLYGETAAVAGATVASEITPVTKPGFAIPLKHPNISALTVSTTADTPIPLVLHTDYEFDAGYGVVYLNPASAIAITPMAFKMAYTYGDYQETQAFLNGLAPERYVRFEGLNGVDGSLRLVEIPRAAFDPITELDYVNDDIANIEMDGSVLPDPLIVASGISKYFRERGIAIDPETTPPA